LARAMARLKKSSSMLNENRELNKFALFVAVARNEKRRESGTVLNAGKYSPAGRST